MSSSNELKLLIGCDPELFLMNPNSGKIVSAEGIVPGDKLNPHKVKKGTIQVDGFAAEIGIEPARSDEEFADNVETVLDELRKFTSGYDFVLKDHHIFDEDVYLGQSDKGRELGCEPDYNAYTRVANNPPVPNPKSLRTCSGHIHIGWTDNADVTDPGHFADCIAVAKQMDWFLGAPTLLWNLGTVRRKLYGKAGCFRVKPYGMEYRTPGNDWLKSRDRMKFMFNNACEGMSRLYKGEHVYQKISADRFINASSSPKELIHSTKYWLRGNKIEMLDDTPFVEEPKVKASTSKSTTRKRVVRKKVNMEPNGIQEVLEQVAPEILPEVAA